MITPKHGPIRLQDIPRIRMLALGFAIMRDYDEANAIQARLDQYVTPVTDTQKQER